MLKGDLRKQAIVDTAETLFFEKGYAGATIQDFLDRLNCSKGSFYHHYESKLQVLTELCRQKAEKGFAAFQAQVYDDNLDRLNGLIYYAMPFRDGEEGTLSLLLPLIGLSDGRVVLDAMLDAQKKLFFPEMEKLLEFLRARGDFHYTKALLPELLWDSYTAVYMRLMEEAAFIRQGGGTGGVTLILEAERFLWERLLDAPFASMELIRADEVLRVIGHAVNRLKYQETPEAQ